MDTNYYAMAALADERLTRARDEARRLDLVALGRPRRRPVRARLGAGLIALGEWLRGDPALVPLERS